MPLIHRGDTEENDGREVKLVSLRSVKGFRKVFVLWPVERWRHIRIPVRDPPTTRSEGFSVLCYPVWGGAPFLSDLGVNPYELTTMSTPGLRRARLPHPVDSVATTRVTTLVPHYPDRSFPFTLAPPNPAILRASSLVQQPYTFHTSKTVSHHGYFNRSFTNAHMYYPQREL